MRRLLPEIDERELATILHSLRIYQDDRIGDCGSTGRAASTGCGHFADFQPLTREETDTLCERLNLAPDVHRLVRRRVAEAGCTCGLWSCSTNECEEKDIAAALKRMHASHVAGVDYLPGGGANISAAEDNRRRLYWIAGILALASQEVLDLTPGLDKLLPKAGMGLWEGTKK
jgi:hypothetical protein